MTTPKKKASAPRPKAQDVEEEQAGIDMARQVHEFSVRGEVVGRLAMGNVPLREKEQVRRQVRASWFDVLGQTGVAMDVWNLSVMVWLARRASGEPGLSWDQFLDEWDDTIRADEIDYPVAPDDGDADPQR